MIWRDLYLSQWMLAKKQKKRLFWLLKWPISYEKDVLFWKKIREDDATLKNAKLSWAKFCDRQSADRLLESKSFLSSLTSRKNPNIALCLILELSVLKVIFRYWWSFVYAKYHLSSFNIVGAIKERGWKLSIINKILVTFQLFLSSKTKIHKSFWH